MENKLIETDLFNDGFINLQLKDDLLDNIDELNDGFVGLNINDDEELSENDEYLDLNVDTEDFFNSYEPPYKKFNDINDIFKEINSLSIATHNSRCGLSHQRLQKVRAFYTENELEKMFYLVDSHVPNLRDKAATRYARLIAELKKDDTETEEHRKQIELLKEYIFSDCPAALEKSIEKIMSQVAEMPKEWNIVQLTSHFTKEDAQNLNINIHNTNQLHLTVFNCGQDKIDPFVITVDAPYHNGNKLELLQQMVNVLKEYEQNLNQTSKQKQFNSRKQKQTYMSTLENTELILKEIVQRLEKNWLREWRCLLIGKFQDKSLEKNIRNELEKMYKEQLSEVIISPRIKELIYYVTKGANYLLISEIENAIRFCLKKLVDEDTITELSRLIKQTNLKIFNQNENHMRYPVILIVDECLDSLPWEMMTILSDEPISRLPSLHFAYLLFKTHENEIRGGHKIIQNFKNGKYVVNPDGDLASMESRIMPFIKHWLPNWTGINNKKPTKDEFCEMLKVADIFSYCGHGNGSHIMSVETLQKLHVRAVVLLFGCASTKLVKRGTQVETYSSYYMYLIARCPCVIGMLWPVTDMYTDVLTTGFLSNWIPSTSKTWIDIDRDLWLRHGEIKLSSATSEPAKNWSNLELLRALSESKKLTNYLTKAACVVRGLPVKIQL